MANVDPTQEVLKILLVEDSSAYAAYLQIQLRQSLSLPYELSHCDNLGDGVAAAAETDFDLIILDVYLPDSEGIDTFLRMQKVAPNASVVLLSGDYSEELALAAMQHGAQDYLVKGQDDRLQLTRSLIYALQRKKQIHELNRTNENLEAFIRAATHDLRAPLRHISSFTSLLREDAAERLLPEDLEYIDRVLGACTRMSQLLKDLLQFARVGAQGLRVNSFPLAEAVSIAISQLPPDQQQHVKLADLPVVYGDRSLIALVLQNLVENALKYIRDGEPEIRIQAESGSTEVRVSIADNGIGINKAEFRRIFDPGVRAIPQSEFPGSGFGLATCVRIIEAHNGKIWVDSTPDQGSTFFFTLPVAGPNSAT